MKVCLALFVLPVLFFASCSHEPIPDFTLSMEKTHGDTLIVYTLTNTALEIHETAPGYTSEWFNDFESEKLDNEAKLRRIGKMKAKSFDCNEQHALVMDRITFTNDSGTVRIDPNVNHPKEIDEAVELFNSFVPENRKLIFEDMQPAIEPDGRMQI